MSKLRVFFVTLFKSLTSPAYYADILKARFLFSLKYFLLFFVFYSLVGTAVFSIKVLPGLNRFLSVFPQRITSIYPAELEVYVKDGSVSTNVEEPYVIPMGRFKEAFSDKVLGDSTSSQVTNIMVIDTKNGSAENFLDYKTAVLVTEKSIVSFDKNNAYKVYPVSPGVNLTINRALVSQAVNKITPFFKYVNPIFVISVFLFIWVFPAGYYQLYLVFFAFVLWLFSKVVKPGLTYEQSFRLGMHMCTISATIFGILSLLNLRISFPFLQTMLLLVFSYFVLSSLKKPPLPSTGHGV